MAKKFLRFGVSNNEGLRAATWKLWTETAGGNSEIYLACRALGGTLKVSMHQSGKWHIAYTQQAFENSVEGFISKFNDRFIEKWPRPVEISHGVTLAFRIITPWSAVSSPIEESTLKKVHWINSPQESKAIEIDILITNPVTPITGWPGKRSMGTSLVGNFQLENKEQVWAVCREIDIPNFDIGKKGTLSFYKGRAIEDLKCQSLRALTFGSEPDGSRVIYDFSINNKLLLKALKDKHQS